MKAQLADLEREEEENRLKAQAKLQKEVGMATGEESAEEDATAKEEVDARSVYVGNVDYAVTPEELQMHFQACGTVNRVTILTDRSGNPKGFAYVEFLEPEAVQHALLLDGSDLHGRTIKVSPKRTNVPGLKQRGRGRGRGRGFYPMMPMMPAPFMYGYGYQPRGRGRGRRGGYNPY